MSQATNVLLQVLLGHVHDGTLRPAHSPNERYSTDIVSAKTPGRHQP
jgi:hypothetical protein